MRILGEAVFLLSLVFTLTVVSATAVAVPQVTLTDSVGNPKSQFQPSEEVFVNGSGFPSNQNMKAYIIPEGSIVPHMTPVDRPLPEKAVASVDITTDSEGAFPVTLIWSPPITPGKYDIWVDVNMNGLYDNGDVLNNEALGISGLFVVPDLPIIILTLAMFGALATLYLMSKRKLSHPQENRKIE